MARLLAYVPLIEGFGIPPVEAMTFGAPVVASLLAFVCLGFAGAPSTAATNQFGRR